jgi:hypothetical protein
MVPAGLPQLKACSAVLSQAMAMELGVVREVLTGVIMGLCDMLCDGLFLGSLILPAARVDPKAAWRERMEVS